MSSCSSETCLSYSSPARGGWSIVRMALQVPESYQLFVGPAACMRHIILSSMELKIDDRISWMSIDESDIVSGGYERQILETADGLLASLSPRPKVFMIFTTCIDNLLGTDHASFLEPLNEKYPGTRCIVCFMNPITGDGPLPPAIHIQDSMYGLLKAPDGQDRAVNFLGDNLAPEADCELLLHLKENGIACRHISQCSTFEEFQKMARSQLNIVVTPLAVYAAKQLQKRLGMDWIYLPVGYDREEIEQGVAAVCDRLNIGRPDTSHDWERVEAAIARARDALHGRRVAVDYAATYRPFGIARLLAQHGIAVSTIFTSECIPADQPAMQWVTKHLPEVKILQPEHFRMVNGCEPEPDCLCIGFECAYYLKSPYVVPLSADGDHYGCAGVIRLMNRIAEGCNRSYNLEKLVKDSGLVV